MSKVLNNIQIRFLLFLGICIPLRLTVAYIAKIIPTTYLPILGVPYFVFAIGFFYLYITNTRLTGGETMGDPIWWKDLRPIHGFLHLLFAILAFKRDTNAWKVLIIDTVFGFVAFWIYHIIMGNLKHLFNGRI
jgi:hypothetical protein